MAVSLLMKVACLTQIRNGWEYMKVFVYVGPVDSAATIEQVDYLLWRGQTVTLPENNDYVLSMIAQGFLREPPKAEPKVETKAKEAK